MKSRIFYLEYQWSWSRKKKNKKKQRKKRKKKKKKKSKKVWKKNQGKKGGGGGNENIHATYYNDAWYLYYMVTQNMFRMH